MIDIHQGWTYQREACDCCDGWWDERYTVSVNGKEIGEYFTTSEDALEAALEVLSIPVTRTFESYHEDD